MRRSAPRPQTPFERGLADFTAACKELEAEGIVFGTKGEDGTVRYALTREGNEIMQKRAPRTDRPTSLN